MKKILFAAVLTAFMLCMFTACGSGGSGSFINSAVLADDGTIDVVWEKVEGADQYEIYRASEEDGEYTQIGKAEGDSTYFTDSNVELHETYWYKVKSVSEGNASDFSEAVGAYVEDKPIENYSISFKMELVGEDAEYGEPFERSSGEGFGTGAHEMKITPYLNREPLLDCDVYYDKSGMEMEPTDSGTYRVHILKPGRYLITVSSGDEIGTLEYVAEKHNQKNEPFSTASEQFGEGKGFNDIYYPQKNDSMLEVQHNGRTATELEAESSNPDIAEVAVEDGLLYVSNKSPGECEISVTGLGNKGEITWVVKRGAAWSDDGTQSAQTSGPIKKAGFNTNSALLADDGSIDIVWKKADKADQYDIYRSSEADGDYSKIGTAKGNKTVYNDKDVKLHETYWYKVKYVSGGEESSFSDAVGVYVSDEPIYNDNMIFELVFPEGDYITGKAGDGALGTNTYNVTITPKLNGNTMPDCKVYYDKSSLKMKKTDSGKYDVEVFRYGKHIITFESGKEKGTFTYAAEKLPEFDNEYFQIYWHQYNEEAGLNTIFYPETKNCVLYIRHGGKYVSEIKAESSDNKIAKVKASKGKVFVTNKSQGECSITVSSGDNTGEITWVVRGGTALEQPAVGGIPISKNVDRDKAKEAIKTILSAEYSDKGMKALVKEDLTLEQWQKKLSKPVDVINMLHALNFGEARGDGKIDNDDVEYGGMTWCRKLSPEGNFKQRALVCLSACEMMNYLLRNDMDEQGYVEYSDPGGGHSFCYYKVNGLYVFCDFVDSVLAVRNRPKDFNVVYVCDDLKDFTDFYVSGPEQNNPKAPGYIDILYMFPMEGRAIPAADDGSGFSLPDCSVLSVFPEKWNGKNTKDLITVLYRADGFQEKYAPGPPESEFPEK